MELLSAAEDAVVAFAAAVFSIKTRDVRISEDVSEGVPKGTPEGALLLSLLLSSVVRLMEEMYVKREPVLLFSVWPFCWLLFTKVRRACLLLLLLCSFTTVTYHFVLF